MNYLLALGAGVLSVGAFAPFRWWWLFLVAMGILFLLWEQADRGRAFRLGLVFGLGQFGAGVYWVYVSIQTFGGMPPVLAGICVFGLVFVLALFPAISGWLQAWFGGAGRAVRLGVLIPVLWLLTEWTRGWIFSGLPWLSAGYAFLDTPLAGLAPVGGVYLVGLIALATVGAVLGMIRQLSPAAFLAALVPIGGWVAGWVLDGHAWSAPQGDRIEVAVIQNNVPLLEKWEEGNRDAIISEYLARSFEHLDKDLVVWPEGAVPDYLENLPPGFWDVLLGHPADFAFGTLHQPPPGTAYYNTLVAVSDGLRLYNKQHLVPYGEFFPMQDLLDPILKYLTIPMADFSPWQSPQEPLPMAGHLAAASICYEDAFPHEWRHQVPEAGFLINVSEDMWFGDTLAPHQRLQMARFRAREAERPMIRSSNNGLSSLINWRGRITEVAPQFEKAVVTGSVQPRTGTTPFVRYGDLPAMILAALMLLAGLLSRLFSLGYNPRSP